MAGKPFGKVRNCDRFCIACQVLTGKHAGCCHGNRWMNQDIMRIRIVQGLKLVASPLGKGSLAVNKNRYIGPQSCSQLLQLMAPQPGMPETIEREQRTGCIAGTSAQASAGRDALVVVNGGPMGGASCLLQQPRGTNNQILIRGQPGQAGPLTDDLPRGTSLHAKMITEADKTKGRLQQVITIGTPPHDMQEQVQLGRCGNVVEGGARGRRRYGCAHDARELMASLTWMRRPASLRAIR